MGTSYVLVSTALNTSIQIRVDEEHRGRVMAIHLMCLLAGVPFGALILGKLASLVGLGESIIGFGLALELCVGRGRALARRPARDRRDPTRPRAHRPAAGPARDRRCRLMVPNDPN